MSWCCSFSTSFSFVLSLSSLNKIKTKVQWSSLSFFCLMSHELPSGDHRYEGLLSSHNELLRPLIEDMTLISQLTWNISLEHPTFFDPISFYPDKEVKTSSRWNKCRFKLPLISKSQRRNWLAWSGYIWVKASRGYSKIPEGLAAETKFIDKKWQDSEMGGSVQLGKEGQQSVGTVSAKESALLPMTFSFFFSCTGLLLSFHSVKQLFTWENPRIRRLF